MLGLTLVNNGISVAFSYISRDFYTALNNRDEHMFYEKIELFFAALVIAVPVAVYYRYSIPQICFLTITIIITTTTTSTTKCNIIFTFASVIRYTREKLSLYWREALTAKVFLQIGQLIM